jgi:hypothetical protein
MIPRLRVYCHSLFYGEGLALVWGRVWSGRFEVIDGGFWVVIAGRDDRLLVRYSALVPGFNPCIVVFVNSEVQLRSGNTVGSIMNGSRVE